jgi:hypothetical protein
MDWRDLERLTVLKLREEALKYPQIESVHGKNKEQLLSEMAAILGIQRPHSQLVDQQIVQTKSEMKHRIHELKNQRDVLLEMRDHHRLHEVRREMHELKHSIRKLEAKAAHG